MESANVVGYDQTGLRFGAKGAGAAFVPVDGAATIDLQDIKVTGYDATEGSEEEVTAQTLDNAGRTLKTYSWIDLTDGSDVYYGWYEDGELVENVSLISGESLYFRAPSTDYYVNFPGVTL